MSANRIDRKTEDRLPELIAERDRYQQWLESLESEQSEIPAHIYERISADYRSRLEAAIEALREHLDSLEDRLQDRKAALDEIEEQLAAKQDELVESQIRHRVGEFDASRWKSLEKELKSAIGKAEARRDELRAEVEQLEETIAQVREQESAPASAASVATESPAFLEVLAEVTASADSTPTLPGAIDNGSGAPPVARPAVSGPDRDDATLPPQRARRPTGLRTLRCDTCGTFNLPEAMFCEACGADLPAT